MKGRIRESVLNLLFPTRGFCLACGDPAGIPQDWLCERCRRKLKPRLHVVRSAQWPEDGVSRAWFASYYEWPANRLVRQFKYGGVYRLAPFLAGWLSPALSIIGRDDFDCLVPVPLHAKRERARGFNQAEMLARLVSDQTGIPLRCGLRRTRNTRQQARLSVSRRQRNLRDAFEATASFDGMRVLLVDDVMTTGSTVNNCAQALRRAGAVDVQAVAVAGSRYYRHREGAVYRKKASKNEVKT